MDQSLSKLGVQSGNQFDCDDFVQHLQFKVIVHHSMEKHLNEFEIISNNTSENQIYLSNKSLLDSNNGAEISSNSFERVTGI